MKKFYPVGSWVAPVSWLTPPSGQNVSPRPVYEAEGHVQTGTRRCLLMYFYWTAGQEAGTRQSATLVMSSSLLPQLGRVGARGFLNRKEAQSLDGGHLQRLYRGGLATDSHFLRGILRGSRIRERRYRHVWSTLGRIAHKTSLIPHFLYCLIVSWFHPLVLLLTCTVIC